MTNRVGVVVLVDGSILLSTAPHATVMCSDPIIVKTNPDDDCSARAFRALIDDLLASPEPELETIGAAEALQELRVDSGA